MQESWDCIIVGAGPAGLMAGLLLARCGVRVLVLEKHGDFLRDFRGDTIHPSTLQILHELGLLDEFQKIGFSKVARAQLEDAQGKRVTVVDLASLKHPYPFIAMAPQWDFLNLLAEAAAKEPSFELRLNCEADELLFNQEQVIGVRYRSAAGQGEAFARLTIAADGRWSKMREQAELPVRDAKVPVDVWWFRVSGTHRVAESLLPAFGPKRVYVLIPRRGYVQAARLLLKGQDGILRQRGIEKFRAEFREDVPALAQGIEKLELEDLKLLEVRVNLASRWWRRGFLGIGDAVHAMSPAGGVGVNLAVQDAVCAARLLATPLATGHITDRDVAAVQRRRYLPTITIQSIQRIMHRGLRRILEQDTSLTLPAMVGTVLERVPWLSRIPARLLGVGLLRERPPQTARR